MFAVILVILIIWLQCGLFISLCTRAPKSMMPKEGDVTTPRQCNFCGNSLAEYRGVLETKSSTAIDGEANQELFFCNYEHQADFHAGKTHTPYA